MSYSQLNTTSAYTFGHSTILAEEYASRARELGYSAIAFNDSSCYAFPRLADAAQKEGVKPVFGYHIRISSGKALPLDASLYVLNETGYLNLCLLISEKQEILGTNILKKYHSGLSLIVDCAGDNFFDKTFLDAIAPDLFAYRKVFEDGFYLGVSLYSELDREQSHVLYEFIDRCQYQSIAYPKALYIRKSDAGKTYLLEKAIAKEKTESIPESGPYFLLSLRALMTLYREKEIQGSDQLTDKVNFTFFSKRGGLIEEEDADEKLERLALKGLNAKMNPVPQEYLLRLSDELRTIREMHFSSYFLIVLDYVTFARNASIRIGPGRGSAGGSLVSYVLNITSIDPIRYGLSFERFLNRKRKNMPDIDIDFEDDRRSEVIDYLKRRYGPSRTADIVTYFTLKPRSALNLIGPALDFNPARLKKLTKVIDSSASTFEEALTCKNQHLGERLKEMMEDPYYREICAQASSLIGLPVNTSIHASGIIVANDDIYRSCPMANGQSGTVLYEYPDMERMGFLKLDILSLSYLTFLRSIEERIVAHGKKVPDIQSDLNDRQTFETANRLDVTDIFQLEKYGMQRTIETIKPDRFTDLAALIALFRPGPKDYIPSYARRKEGKEKIVYEDDRLKPILEETYGIMVYQEQVIEAVKVLALFSAGDADLFRRAISKKDLSKMEAYKDQFLQGCQKNGILLEKATKIYADIEKFADYGFNKSHAYSYALIAYTLLYEKTHFPEEFYQSAFPLKSLSDEGTQSLMGELKRLGYHFRNPDINRSEKSDLLFDQKIIYLPFSSIRGCDMKIVDHILEERQNSPFSSYYSFAKRCTSFLSADLKPIESMIDAGVFDTFSANRSLLNEKLQDYLEFARLGFEDSQIPSLESEEEDLGLRMLHEKSALGILLSTRLSHIATKEGYRTLLVTDTSDLDLHHTLVAENENRIFHLRLNQKVDAIKYGFLLVRGDFRRDWLTPDDVIVIGRKVIRHV